jgi:hypothetical protein
MPNPEHEGVKSLSVSKVDAAMLCPRKFRYTYVDKIPSPAVGIMMAGSAFHAAMEWALREVVLGHGLPSAKDLDDRFPEIWEATKKEEEAGDRFGGTWDWDRGDSEERALLDYRHLVHQAREHVLPNLKPKLVEHDFKIMLPSPLGDYPLYGVVDLLEEDGLMSDWKTVGKVSDRQKNMGVQFMGYSIWHKGYTGMEVTRARKIFLAREPVAHVEYSDTYEVGQLQRDWFAGVASELWVACKNNGGFVPNTNGWWCSSKWCKYWDACRGEIDNGAE